MISHTNGKISTMVAGISTRCHGLNGRRRLRRAGNATAEALMSGPVVHESAAAPELQARDSQDDDEQEVGDRGGVAVVETALPAEGQLVEVVDQHGRRVQRTALSAQVDLVE